MDNQLYLYYIFSFSSIMFLLSSARRYNYYYYLTVHMCNFPNRT